MSSRCNGNASEAYRIHTAMTFATVPEVKYTGANELNPLMNRISNGPRSAANHLRAAMIQLTDGPAMIQREWNLVHRHD